MRLTGYGPSVYTRAVRIALHELLCPYDWRACDPFEEEGRRGLLPLNPFGRVPILECGDATNGAVTIYETRAILAYLSATFGRTQTDALSAARIAQVQGIADSHGYWPLVRDVYSHGFFRPAMGEPADPGRIAHGLAAASPVLDALDAIAEEGRVLAGHDSASDTNPADWHLFPMIDAFQTVPDGSDLLSLRPRLARWHAAFAARESARATLWQPEAGT